MLFNSIEFLFFLPLVFTVYWLVLRGGEMQECFYNHSQLRVLRVVGLAVPALDGVDHVLQLFQRHLTGKA